MGVVGANSAPSDVLGSSGSCAALDSSTLRGRNISKTDEFGSTYLADSAGLGTGVSRPSGAIADGVIGTGLDAANESATPVCTCKSETGNGGLLAGNSTGSS